MAEKKKKPSVKRKKRKQGAELLAEVVIAGIQEKKGKEIVSMDLRNVQNTVVDYFVICHAESVTHVKAIADSVEEFVFKKTGEKPWHSEGRDNAEWILLDFVSVVVHVFREDRRRYYNLERLWGDGEIENIA